MHPFWKATCAVCGLAFCVHLGEGALHPMERQQPHLPENHPISSIPLPSVMDGVTFSNTAMTATAESTVLSFLARMERDRP